MAKVNLVKACTVCRAELPDPTPEKCPKCHAQLAAPDNAFFASPEYLAFQLEHHERDFGERVRGFGTAKNEAEQKRIDLETSKLAETMEKVRGELRTWARSCPTEDKVAAMIDAQVIMQNILHGPVPIEHLRRITSMAKQIGKLGTAVEEYFRNGGTLHDAEVGRVLADYGDDPGGQETAH